MQECISCRSEQDVYSEVTKTALLSVFVRNVISPAEGREHQLLVLQNITSEIIFGRKRKEVTERWIEN
jgi:hypothetical protein